MFTFKKDVPKPSSQPGHPLSYGPIHIDYRTRQPVTDSHKRQYIFPLAVVRSASNWTSDTPQGNRDFIPIRYKVYTRLCFTNTCIQANFASMARGKSTLWFSQYSVYSCVVPSYAFSSHRGWTYSISCEKLTLNVRSYRNSRVVEKSILNLIVHK